MSIPLAMTIWYSFSRYNLLNPDVKGFAGFDNYRFLATDPSFLPAIWHTLVLIGAVLAITVIGGVLMAVLFDRKFYGQGRRAAARDRAVLRDADGVRADLEEHDPAPGVRGSSRTRCARSG